jgi:hypothetical protein
LYPKQNKNKQKSHKTRQDGFKQEYYQNFKELIAMLLKLFHKIETDEIDISLIL